MLGINSWPRQQTCLKGPFRPCNSELSQMKVDNRVTNPKDNCSPQRDTTLRDDLVLWQPKPDSIRLALLLTLSFRFYHAYKSQLCGTRAASFFVYCHQTFITQSDNLMTKTTPTAGELHVEDAIVVFDIADRNQVHHKRITIATFYSFCLKCH